MEDHSRGITTSLESPSQSITLTSVKQEVSEIWQSDAEGAFTPQERAEKDQQVANLLVERFIANPHLLAEQKRDQETNELVSRTDNFAAGVADAVTAMLNREKHNDVVANGGISRPNESEDNALITTDGTHSRVNEEVMQKLDASEDSDSNETHIGSRFDGFRGLNRGQRKEALRHHREAFGRTPPKREMIAQLDEQKDAPAEAVGITPFPLTTEAQTSPAGKADATTPFSKLEDHITPASSDKKPSEQGYTNLLTTTPDTSGPMSTDNTVSSREPKSDTQAYSDTLAQIKALGSDAFNNDNTNDKATFDRSTPIPSMSVDNPAHPDRAFDPIPHPEARRTWEEAQKAWHTGTESVTVSPVIEESLTKKKPLKEKVKAAVVIRGKSALLKVGLATGVTGAVIAATPDAVLAPGISPALPLEGQATSLVTGVGESYAHGASNVEHPEEKKDEKVGEVVTVQQDESISGIQDAKDTTDEHYLPANDFEAKIYENPVYLGEYAKVNRDVIYKNFDGQVERSVIDADIAAAISGNADAAEKCKKYLSLVQPGDKVTLLSLDELHRLAAEDPNVPVVGAPALANDLYRVQTDAEVAQMQDEIAAEKLVAKGETATIQASDGKLDETPKQEERKGGNFFTNFFSGGNNDSKS